MALQEQGRPPSYSHDPDTLHLPSVPSKDLPSIAVSDGVHLPDFKSLRLPESSRHPLPTTNGDASQWHGLLPLNQNVFPPVPSGALRPGPEEVGSPMDISSLEDPAHQTRAASVSMEDPDVRTAAEALTGLRSPSNRNTGLPMSNGDPGLSSREPEPLLSLLTSSHPWLGGTINGSLSAYATTKHYSPRFVRNVAESVERNIGAPMANTVSAVGKRTGVEDGLRRYLGTHRRPSDLERGDADPELGGPKRRRLDPSADSTENEYGLQTPLSLRTRTDSQTSHTDSLPAYDDQRSPRYEEINAHLTDSPSESQGEERRNWSTQLMITTSGLGAALNETALRNLKFCLSLLRGATHRIDEVMSALKMVIEDYEKAQMDSAEHNAACVNGDSINANQEERCRQLADRMKELGTAIWQTLHGVVEKVSTYAGGALPANAQQIVRSQLTSMPYRWQRSTAASESGSSGEVKNANRMLAFAKEGLDMMGQVSKVVDGTIVSAERWLDRMGKKPQKAEEAGEKAEIEKLLEAVSKDAYGYPKTEKN